ncbi:MAG: segregation/condensation protein A [Nanoarchaeota archaeon]
MPSESNGLTYIKPEEKIYDIAVNKEIIDWKSFLYDLIYTQNLDPWNIDLSILTKKYIESLKKLKEIDFDVSGKFLTIAVFLLKTKTQALLEKDIRGMDNAIASVEADQDGIEELDSLEELDNMIDQESSKKKTYKITYRNPIARKRKVTIFDLIQTLEKTIEQSNRRRENFFQRHGSSKYDGPMYQKKPKDLKQLINELLDLIVQNINDKKAHVTFSHITNGIEHKMGIIEKFMPLLHLHNQSRVEVKQNYHFGDIEIYKK